MFKVVENEVELAQFNGVWTTVWHECGYELEFGDHVLDKNIILTENKEVIGSNEIKCYYPDSRSYINTLAAFAQHPWVVQAEGKVGECDKVALLKNYRGKGMYIHDILKSICASALKHDLQYIVSLLEPVFMKALKRLFRVPMQQVGDPFFYKGDYVVPVVMDVGFVITHKEQFTWYIENAVDREHRRVMSQ